MHLCSRLTWYRHWYGYSIPFCRHTSLQSIFLCRTDTWYEDGWAHVHMYEFFQGVPARLVCDNLKTGSPFRYWISLPPGIHPVRFLCSKSYEGDERCESRNGHVLSYPFPSQWRNVNPSHSQNTWHIQADSQNVLWWNYYPGESERAPQGSNNYHRRDSWIQPFLFQRRWTGVARQVATHGKMY